MAQVVGAPSHLTTCRSCTIMLVQLARSRSWRFRVFRGLLVWGMRVMAWWHCINATRHHVGNPECRGCIRFVKNELKEKSPTFRWLNSFLDSIFNRLRDANISAQEKVEAKNHAMQATGMGQF